jgi:hypothetical protein
MKFSIDLTKVQELKPIPTGVYVVKIVEIDTTKKSKAGLDKMVIKSEILAPASVTQQQKFFWFTLSLADAALFRVKQLMEAVGIPIKATGFDTADLIGRELGIVVTEETTKEFGHRNQVVNYLKAKETKPELKQPAA